LAEKNTYQLLKQWLLGAAGYREEQQLNRQAESDDFLAEALDGYAAMPEGAHAERVQQLKRRVWEKARKKKRVPAYWLRVAAAVLLIGFASGVFWYLNQPASGPLTEKRSPVEEEQKDAELATVEEKKSEAADERAETSTSQQPTAADVPEAQPSEAATSQGNTKELAPKPSNPVAPLPQAPAAPQVEEVQEDNEVAIVEENVPAFNDAMGQLADEEPSEALPPAPKKKRSEDLARQNMEAPPPPVAYHLDSQRPGKEEGEQSGAFILKGRVLEQSTGQPLIGANVLIVGTDQGTVTDTDGDFSLEVPGDSAQIMVNSVGFQSLELFVERGDSVEIRLPNSALALEEVVVTSKSTSRKSNAKAQQPPQPEDGLRKFKKYLRQNLKYPVAAQQASIKGEVVLSFAVDNDNRPVDIRVEKSLGYGCDEEAIRLLRVGPGWESGKGRGEYTFKFP